MKTKDLEKKFLQLDKDIADLKIQDAERKADVDRLNGVVEQLRQEVTDLKDALELKEKETSLLKNVVSQLITEATLNAREPGGQESESPYQEESQRKKCKSAKWSGKIGGDLTLVKSHSRIRRSCSLQDGEFAYSRDSFEKWESKDASPTPAEDSYMNSKDDANSLPTTPRDEVFSPVVASGGIFSPPVFSPNILNITLCLMASEVSLMVSYVLRM